MTAKQLIKILQEDPNRIIVLSADGEGNRFMTLNDATPFLFKDEEIFEEGHPDDPAPKGAKKALVLWPNG